MKIGKLSNKKAHRMLWDEISLLVLDKELMEDLIASKYNGNAICLKLKKLAYCKMVEKDDRVVVKSVPMNYCYACDESMDNEDRFRIQKLFSDHCDYCPIEWIGNDCNCCDSPSVYGVFIQELTNTELLKEDFDRYQQQLHRIAKVIAGMKWRKKIWFKLFKLRDKYGMDNWIV